MEKSFFEQMGGIYRQEGDYFFPDLTVPESVPVGIWGQRRRQYLREHRKALYNALLLSGKLDSHLTNINQQAEDMFYQLIEQMAEQVSITEQLKANSQMEWVGRMNNIRSRAIELIKLFKVIGLDKSQISNVGVLVGTRNEMAHATGKFEILTEESFDVKTSSVLASMKNIHRCMDQPIRKWCEQILLSYCAEEGEYGAYSNPADFITEQMIQSFKLSVNELLVCNEMSVSHIITAHRGYSKKLKEYKATLATYCADMGYVLSE